MADGFIEHKGTFFWKNIPNTGKSSSLGSLISSNSSQISFCVFFKGVHCSHCRFWQCPAIFAAVEKE